MSQKILKYNEAHTQKARGFLFLWERHYSWPFSSFYCDGLFSNAQVWPHQSEVTLPCFARPCPMRPRHGFVESRLVSNAREVMDLVSETIRADSGGEVIFMPRAEGRWSGILHNAGIAFGPGNDGATSGAGSVNIPGTICDAVKWNAYFAGTHSDELGLDNVAYIELVEHKGDHAPVQMRDGPAQVGAINYIPERVTVAAVIQAGGDLLAWEKTIHAAPAGTVVYHPDGNLSSHYAVHALVRKLPVIVKGDCPQVGQVLEPEGDVPATSTQAYAIVAGRMAGEWAFPLKGKLNEIATAVGTLHAVMRWSLDETHLARLAGYAMPTLVRFMIAACMGELRHYGRCGPGQRRYRKANARLGVAAESQRNKVYKRALQKTDSAYLARWIARAQSMFEEDGWNGGYGGRKWAEVAEGAKNALARLSAFIAAKDAASFGALVAALNLAVNTCHNNGKVLNKWIDGRSLAYANHAPQLALASPMTWRVLSNERIADREDKQGVTKTQETEAECNERHPERRGKEWCDECECYHRHE